MKNTKATSRLHPFDAARQRYAREKAAENREAAREAAAERRASREAAAVAGLDELVAEVCASPLPVRRSLGKRQAWTKTELKAVVDLYLAVVTPEGTYDVDFIEREHARRFPRGGSRGVRFIPGQIRHCDTRFPSLVGWTSVTAQLREVLAEVDPDRFDTTR
jgi:hypothetical protein